MKGAFVAREARDLARTLGVALPPALVAGWLAWRGDGHGAWIALLLALASSTIIAWSVRGALRRRLQTVTSVLASYREGDFSIRARVARDDAPLKEVLEEVNQLGATLREHRLGAMEVWALLRKVMAEVDVVMLAFDGEGRVRLANEAAARLFGKTASALASQDVAALGLADLLSGAAPRVVKDSPALGPNAWELRRGAFRLSGEPHTLVVLSDMSGALRDNERDAWRRLIRVMGHEINNSLSPIRSMSEGLLAALGSPPPRSASFEEDLREALGVIARRSEALARFMASYATLARLPPPRPTPVDVRALVEKTALVERRTTVEVVGGPDATIRADGDQLEQVLINLVKNAADAALTMDGGVRVRWTSAAGFVEITVEDDGPGIGDTSNLFVPFFTTKPGGSGIGLVLCREIVEAHKGQLSLSERKDGRGALARVRLPRA